MFGVSAPISVIPFSALSMACMSLPDSAGSSDALNSPNVVVVSSPPSTDR